MTSLTEDPIATLKIFGGLSRERGIRTEMVLFGLVMAVWSFVLKRMWGSLSGQWEGTLLGYDVCPRLERNPVPRCSTCRNADRALERGGHVGLATLFSVMYTEKSSQLGRGAGNRANFQKWENLPPQRAFSFNPGKFPLFMLSLIKKSMYPSNKFSFLALASHLGFWLL